MPLIISDEIKRYHKLEIEKTKIVACYTNVGEMYHKLPKHLRFFLISSG